VRLSEPIEKSGYFWLPEDPEKRLPGVLRTTETGETTVEVIGIFGDESAAIGGASPDLDRVVGMLESGDMVTLDRCFYKHRNIRFGGLSKSTIHARFLLSGASYNKGEPITFSMFNFSVEGLDEWLCISGIRIERNSDGKSASIHFAPPNEIPLLLPDGPGDSALLAPADPPGL